MGLRTQSEVELARFRALTTGIFMLDYAVSMGAAVLEKTSLETLRRCME